jgi:SAM-dependent methyltransferase
MSTATKHYQELLAEHYIWMFGLPFEEKVAEQKALLRQILSPAACQGAAFDLGSGPGFQTIALAELGYSPVIAVDTSAHLLAELRAHRGSLPVETNEADLLSFESIGSSQSAAVIVCMGDTLTHLPSKTAVKDLFAAVFRRLAPGGVFVITYRDLTSELLGLERFLPVRADDTKILTCFLEYKDQDAVVVNDLLYVREGNGWRLKKSNYQKLRLSQDWVTNALSQIGFEMERVEPAGGMLLIAAHKMS